MRVRELPQDEQDVLRCCLRFALESGQLGGEFDTRMGVSEAEVRHLLRAWPDVDDVADDSAAVHAISNAMNEVCHGVLVRDWDRWFSISPADVKQAHARWARGRGWNTAGMR